LLFAFCLLIFYVNTCSWNDHTCFGNPVKNLHEIMWVFKKDLIKSNYIFVLAKSLLLYLLPVVSSPALQPQLYYKRIRSKHSDSKVKTTVLPAKFIFAFNFNWLPVSHVLRIILLFFFFRFIEVIFYYK